MANQADIVLEQDGTRVVNDVDVAVGPNADPNVTLDPGGATISVGGGGTDSGTSIGSIEARNPDDTPVIWLSANNGGNAWVFDPDSAGKVGMGAGDGGTITMDGSEGNQTVRLDTDDGRGNIFLWDEQDQLQVTVEAGDDGGEIVLNDEEGMQTCFMHGDDAAIELRGQPDQPDYEEGEDRIGGGELVLSAAGGGAVDTRVHISGDIAADYGHGRGHRPRIFIDGPSATAELGRGPQENGGDPAEGSIGLRDTEGDFLLTARAESPTHGGNGKHVPEIYFGYRSEEDPQPRGAIRSHRDGLMLYDANDDPALLIDTNGEIHTAGPIHEGSL